MSMPSRGVDKGPHQDCSTCHGAGVYGTPGMKCPHCAAFWIAEEFKKLKSEAKPVTCTCICCGKDTAEFVPELRHCYLCGCTWNPKNRRPTVTEAEAREAYIEKYDERPPANDSWWKQDRWDDRLKVWLAALRWREGVGGSNG